MLSYLRSAISGVASAVSRRSERDELAPQRKQDPDPVVGYLSADHEAWHSAVQELFRASYAARSSLRQFLLDYHALAISMKRLDALAQGESQQMHTRRIDVLQHTISTSGGQDALDAFDWGILRPVHRAEAELAELGDRLKRRQQVHRDLEHWSAYLASLYRSANSSAHRFARGIQQRLADGFTAVARNARGGPKPSASAGSTAKMPSESAFKPGRSSEAPKSAAAGDAYATAGMAGAGGTAAAPSGFGRQDTPLAVAGGDQAVVVERLAAAQAEYDAITAAMRSELVRWRYSRPRLAQQVCERGATAVGLLLQEAGARASEISGIAASTPSSSAARHAISPEYAVRPSQARALLSSLARADRENFERWSAGTASDRESVEGLRASSASGKGKGEGSGSTTARYPVSRLSPALGSRGGQSLPELPPLQLSPGQSSQKEGTSLDAGALISALGGGIDTQHPWWEARQHRLSGNPGPLPSAPPAEAGAVASEGKPSELVASSAHLAPDAADASCVGAVGLNPAADGSSLGSSRATPTGAMSRADSPAMRSREGSLMDMRLSPAGLPPSSHSGPRKVRIRRTVPAPAFSRARVVPQIDGPECSTFEEHMRCGQAMSLNMVLLDQTMHEDRLGNHWLVSRLDRRDRWMARRKEAILAGDPQESAALEVHENAAAEFSVEAARSRTAVAAESERKSLVGLVSESADWASQLAEYLDVRDLSALYQSCKPIAATLAHSPKPWLRSCWSGGVPSRLRARFWSWVTGSSPALGRPPAWSVAATGMSLDLVQLAGPSTAADKEKGRIRAPYAPCTASEYSALCRVALMERREAGDGDGDDDGDGDGGERAEWADLIEQDVLRTHFGLEVVAGRGSSAAVGEAESADSKKPHSPLRVAATPSKKRADTTELASPILERSMATISKSLQVPVTALQLERGIRTSIVGNQVRVSGSAASPARAAGSAAAATGRSPSAESASSSAGSRADPAILLHRKRVRLTRLLYACAQAFSCRYCQGMNYLAAMLLEQCDAEGSEAVRDPAGATDDRYGGQGGMLDWSSMSITAGEVLSFNLLRQLFDQRGMEGLFSRDMRAVGPLLFALEHVLWRLLPDAQAALKRAGISPAMFATGWVMTLLSNERAVPRELAPRVWDAFLVGGWPELLRAVVAVIAAMRSQIVSGLVVRAGAQSGSDGEGGLSENESGNASGSRLGALGSSSRTDDDAMSRLLPMLMSPRKFEPMCRADAGRLWLACVSGCTVQPRMVEEAVAVVGREQDRDR